MSTRRQNESPTISQIQDTRQSNSEETRPAKARRSRLACRRCQQRKIKCDENVPQCSACQRAGVRCEDGQRTGVEGSTTRSQARYIKRLESALRERIPDFSLEILQSNNDNEILIEQAGDDQPATVPNPHSRQADTSRVRNVTEPTYAQQPVSVPHYRTSEEISPPSIEEGRGSNNVAHEIGLVPLSSGTNKYVGPSSGFVFAKTIFNRAGRDSRGPELLANVNPVLAESPSTITSRSLLSIKPEALPSSLSHAIQLSCIYFEHIHIQYPFLYRPAFLQILHKVYEVGDLAQKWMLFQVRMVLAISATILARRLPIPYSGEGLYASAMQDTDEIDFHSSLDGIQCLLLVYMFNLHSPYGNVSSWHLNYQCLAVVLDLGLQRDLPPSTNISRLEREMRTRIFWVVYSIDRTLATTLGRPIGLRDEACDLRMPNDIEDDQLQDPENQHIYINEPEIAILESCMTCALTLFELAHLNSELKYVLHSVSHTTPRYTYPQITNIEDWQTDLCERLQTCFNSAPKFTDERRYLSIICEIRYHEVNMHLFRPTPRIRSPKVSNLLICYESATKTIFLWKELHKMDRLSYSWVMVHSVCLSALTILYGIWTSPEIARSAKIDAFMATMREASVLLSIVGEYWTEARQSRSRLDELVNATIRWLIDKLTSAPYPSIPLSSNSLPAQAHQGFENTTSGLPVYATSGEAQTADDAFERNGFSESFSNYVNNDDLITFLGASNAFFGDSDMLMDSLFVDYQPLFDFNGGDVNSNIFS